MPCVCVCVCRQLNSFRYRALVVIFHHDRGLNCISHTLFFFFIDCRFSLVPLQGHSHQLFHVCAVVGTYFQMEAVLADMTSRKEWLMSQSALPSFMGTLGAFALGVLLNLAVIGAFSASLLRTPCQSTSASGAAHARRALPADKED